LNASILELELHRFIVDPQDLKLSWEPATDYPNSVIVGTEGGLAAAFSLLVRGDLNGFGEKYKHRLLNALGLNLGVNGRAPVTVYLGPRS
jgi:hypothetical protein